MKLPIALAAAALLAGCAGQPIGAPVPLTLTPAPTATPAQQDPLAQLATFTTTDLANADTIAVANGDDIAHACYPALAKFVASFQGTGTAQTVSGAFSAFERVRAARLNTQTAIPTYLKLGCAALVQDETVFIAKLVAIGTAGAASGGASLPLALPGLVGLPALPIAIPGLP